EQQLKPLAELLLIVNVVLFAVVLGIGGWAVNKAIDDGFIIGRGFTSPTNFSPIYFPFGNAATGFFVTFSLIAGVVGIASAFSGADHVRYWDADSLPAANSAASISFGLTLLAMGFAWKEIGLYSRNRRLETLEGLIIVLAATQLLYIAAIHGAATRRR
ncbi:hypothetical protein M569_06323, partial [Genlisea aurea]